MRAKKVNGDRPDPCLLCGNGYSQPYNTRSAPSITSHRLFAGGRTYLLTVTASETFVNQILSNNCMAATGRLKKQYTDRG